MCSFSEIDLDMLKHLVQSTQLNRMEKFRKLFPKKTTADGNCLIHATMLSVDGKEDIGLKTRKNLNKMLADKKSKQTQQIKKIWKAEGMAKSDVYGYTFFSEEDWENEWNLLVNLSSPHPTNDNTYQMLESFHVFVLANAIKTPIVVVSEKFIYSVDGDAFSPIDFGGVYLPLIHPPTECCKSPVVLAYNDSHFCPLILATGHEEKKFPLENPSGELLSIHYAQDIINKSSALSLLQKYLDISIEKVSRKNVPCMSLRNEIRFNDRHVTVARIDTLDNTVSSTAKNAPKSTVLDIAVCKGETKRLLPRYKKPKKRKVYIYFFAAAENF